MKTLARIARYLSDPLFSRVRKAELSPRIAQAGRLRLDDLLVRHNAIERLLAGTPVREIGVDIAITFFAAQKAERTEMLVAFEEVVDTITTEAGLVDPKDEILQEAFTIVSIMSMSRRALLQTMASAATYVGAASSHPVSFLVRDPSVTVEEMAEETLEHYRSFSLALGQSEHFRGNSLATRVLRSRGAAWERHVLGELAHLFCHAPALKGPLGKVEFARRIVEDRALSIATSEILRRYNVRGKALSNLHAAAVVGWNPGEFSSDADFLERGPWPFLRGGEPSWTDPFDRRRQAKLDDWLSREDLARALSWYRKEFGREFVDGLEEHGVERRFQPGDLPSDFLEYGRLTENWVRHDYLDRVHDGSCQTSYALDDGFRSFRSGSVNPVNYPYELFEMYPIWRNFPGTSWTWPAFIRKD